MYTPNPHLPNIMAWPMFECREMGTEAAAAPRVAASATRGMAGTERNAKLKPSAAAGASTGPGTAKSKLAPSYAHLVVKPKPPRKTASEMCVQSLVPPVVHINGIGKHSGVYVCA